MTMDLKDLDVVTEQLEKPYMKLLDDVTLEQIIEALPPEALEAIRRMKS